MVMEAAVTPSTFQLSRQGCSDRSPRETELGPIPVDWEVDYIENVATITTGSRNTQDRVADGAYPFFVRSQDVERINSYAFDREAVLTAGGGVGTGKVFHYINGKFDSHQRVYVISEFAPRLNGYYFYLYFSENFYNRIMQMTAKSSVDSVRREMIARMPIALPPIAEQKAIAQALSDTDALTENLERLIDKKRQAKQGVMQELLSARRRLPGFEGEWYSRSFAEIFDFYPTATNSRADLDESGDTYYIHYGDIHTRFHNHLNFQHKQPPKISRHKCRNAAHVRNGDWIMADASEDFDGVCKSIEVLGLSEADRVVSGLHTFLLREKVPTFVPGFKGHLGNLKPLRDQYLRVMTGMKVFGVSKAALRDLTLPIPEPAEQEAIVSILNDMDDEIATLESKLAKTRLLKQGLMQELLTGRVRLV
jgi:type I restriction enzyme S subunit